ncbi:hypothetical protein SAMD00019534_116060 [Acytostelium subglobosum LB1]|uniref:hypothetical protein n=1 Tax=Acytostelium subglobosum LB1 TaxID=1410327 RepID=UPI000644D3A8|nr:hypothetical protein SAMD00019534_116060 [Acytostelium subglobosum LB1]GAM28430.1 hypothetical protein SAMD00019534_116060 [Acytostelium subglobosum LB1]|eukprot:XP_012748747.1 hypothetical protein SAMD00019534_116060 [Acytostelium subglobosum LB1]
MMTDVDVVVAVCAGDGEGVAVGEVVGEAVGEAVAAIDFDVAFEVKAAAFALAVGVAMFVGPNMGGAVLPPPAVDAEDIAAVDVDFFVLSRRLLLFSFVLSDTVSDILCS